MKNGETVAPAMTPQEWAEGNFSRTDLSIERHVGDDSRLHVYILDGADVGDDDEPATVDVGHELTPDERHALAATCLHGQPFGFTWEDVDLIRLAQSIVGDAYGPRSDSELFDSLAERIEALLPPREKI